jgi:hypothetical protein
MIGFLFHFRCWAHNGRAGGRQPRQLFGIKRTPRYHGAVTANDLSRTLPPKAHAALGSSDARRGGRLARHAGLPLYERRLLSALV